MKIKSTSSSINFSSEMQSSLPTSKYVLMNPCFRHLLPQIKRKVTETQEEDDDSPAYSQKVYCTHGSDLQKLRRDISSSNKEVRPNNKRL